MREDSLHQRSKEGPACGHGFGDWLASVEGGHDYLHGERVFVGLIVQMILEKYPMMLLRSNRI